MSSIFAHLNQLIYVNILVIPGQIERLQHRDREQIFNMLSTIVQY